MHLRDRIVEETERVTAAHLDGAPGRVVMKMNSLIDGPLIEALYRASRAGVSVDLVIRGICGLRAGVPGVSENIRVVSIVGRFLEHARIFAFESNGLTRCFIGSADMMARNLDHRVEVVTPVEDPEAVADLLTLLNVQLEDTALAWTLEPDGTWRLREPGPGDEPLNSQDELMRLTAARADAARAGA
jgi:polyphosphate kinase